MHRPDVLFRHRDVLREAAVAIDPDDVDFLADVSLAGAAGLAVAAADVAFSADALADATADDGIAARDDLADEFMAGRDADRNTALAPRVPFVNVPIRAADAG